MNSLKAKISITIDRSLLNQLQKDASAQCRSLSRHICLILSRYHDFPETKIIIRKKRP